MKARVRVLTLVTVSFALSAGAAAQSGDRQVKQPATGSTARHVLLAPADIKWGPAPPGLPAGGQMAVLTGDPSKPAAFAVSLKVPDAYVIPPHWHPTDENVVVTEGAMMLGMGDKIDEGSMTTISDGGFARLPKQMHHYAKANGATTLVIYGMGPLEITYVNPTDDPRKKSSGGQ